VLLLTHHPGYIVLEETGMSENLSIESCARDYLRSVEQARSANTHKTYSNGIRLFLLTLEEHGIKPAVTFPTELPEEAIAWFAQDLKDLAPTTERLYIVAANGFFQYLAAEGLSQINLPRVHLLIRQRTRRPGIRLPQFPIEAIETVLKYAEDLHRHPAEEDAERLRNYRDRAFLITLADTGLRVHEICALRRGDVDWNEGQAVIIGKGDKQAVVRFSNRSMTALKEYLAQRAPLLDGKSGRSLGSLPLFSRHDRGAGEKVKPITTTTGRDIVTERVREALGEEAVGSITPHSFRHYFVTTVLRVTGNLKVAQELARHENISVTTRYSHLLSRELDQQYNDIFNER